MGWNVGGGVRGLGGQGTRGPRALIKEVPESSVTLAITSGCGRKAPPVKPEAAARWNRLALAP